MKFRAPVVILSLLFSAIVPAAAEIPITVQLDWKPNAQFAGLLVAKEKGWYKQAGLDVSIQPIDLHTMDAIGPVIEGKNCIGCADGLALLRARSEGFPVKVFATMLQASPIGIFVLEDGPIKRMEDLRGKRIGLHSYDRAHLAILLASHGLKLSDVTVVVVGDDTTSLPSGKIDAQVGYAIDEKVALEVKGVRLRSFPGYENGFQTYSQAYWAKAELVRNEPALLTTFLRISNRGWEDAFAHPHETAEMIVRRYLPGGDLAYQEGSIREVEHYARLESPRLGEMKLSTWVKCCRAFGYPPQLVDRMVDFSILHRLYGDQASALEAKPGADHS